MYFQIYPKSSTKIPFYQNNSTRIPFWFLALYQGCTLSHLPVSAVSTNIPIAIRSTWLGPYSLILADEVVDEKQRSIFFPVALQSNHRETRPYFALNVAHYFFILCCIFFYCYWIFALYGVQTSFPDSDNLWFMPLHPSSPKKRCPMGCCRSFSSHRRTNSTCWVRMLRKFKYFKCVQ